MQVGFFATPILYPITIFAEKYHWLVMLNPMARIISMMRDAILYHSSPDPWSLAYVVATSLAVLLLGYFIFDQMEPKFAEAI